MNTIKFVDPEYPGDGQGVINDRQGSLLIVDTERGIREIPVYYVFEGTEHIPVDEKHDRLQQYAEVVIPEILGFSLPILHQQRYQNVSDYDHIEKQRQQQREHRNRLKRELPEDTWFCFEYQGNLYGLANARFYTERYLYCKPWSHLPSIKRFKRETALKKTAEAWATPVGIVVACMLFAVGLVWIKSNQSPLPAPVATVAPLESVNDKGLPGNDLDNSLAISDEQTSSIAFPAQITTLRVKSNDIVAETFEDSPHIVRLRATRPNFKQTQLTVIDEHGRSWIYSLRYRENLTVLSIQASAQ